MPSARVSQTIISKLKVAPSRPRRSHSRGSSSAAAAEQGETCPCVIRLTVLNSSSSGSHKFKLDALFSGFQIYNPRDLGGAER